jgi:hypothetical protein
MGAAVLLFAPSSWWATIGANIGARNCRADWPRAGQVVATAPEVRLCVAGASRWRMQDPGTSRPSAQGNNTNLETSVYAPR